VAQCLILAFLAVKLSDFVKVLPSKDITSIANYIAAGDTIVTTFWFVSSLKKFTVELINPVLA
jgi:hypothetical protein